MVVGFTTACAISAYNHHRCEFEYGSCRCVLDTILCDNICHRFVAGRWLSLCTPVSSRNKTDGHILVEILLKVALTTITLTIIPSNGNQKPQ